MSTIAKPIANCFGACMSAALLAKRALISLAAGPLCGAGAAPPVPGVYCCTAGLDNRGTLGNLRASMRIRIAPVIAIAALLLGSLGAPLRADILYVANVYDSTIEKIT